MLESFTLRGSNGYITIQIDEVYGFPDNTSHFGGYDCQCSLEIQNDGYSVKSSYWGSTGEIFSFYKALAECNSTLSGNVEYLSSEHNLNFTLTYDNFTGNINIKGVFESTYASDRLLRFNIESDQSYIQNSLKELEIIYNNYGDNKGISRK